jgi:hypothetical protein
MLVYSYCTLAYKANAAAAAKRVVYVGVSLSHVQIETAINTSLPFYTVKFQSN